MELVIHWFRRDLRVHDNTALQAAFMCAQNVLPVLVLENALRTGPDVGAARLAVLLEAASELKQTLAALGYRLLVRQGASEQEIPRICRESKAEAVFCNRRYEPYAAARDARVARSLGQMGVAFRSFKDAVLWEDTEIRTQAGQPYTVFTPYAKRWRAQPVAPPWPGLKSTVTKRSSFESVPIPPDPAAFGFRHRQAVMPSGETAATAEWNRFLRERLITYAQTRDIPSLAGTSRMSVHLRCGTIGIRTIVSDLLQVREATSEPGRKSCDVFLTELIWREFYSQILANFPHVMKGSFRPKYDRLRWSSNEKHFVRWSEGRTGYPIVDAAMRCLNATGWMHNRLRMIVAMFLTKDLLLNWQWGERYFMQQLADGDMAANNGGWQWCAGTGTDAAPYFRIFNPVTQGQKFDGAGDFVRQWIPELQDWSPKTIHQPWVDAPKWRASKYPRRMVIHEEQRPECLAMYKAIRP